MHNILDFGAVGDGKTLNTEAIQAAIDACPQGGTVLVPAGCFVTGALFLKSEMTLHLEKGAELLGSGNIEDYPIFEGQFEGRQELIYASLLNAVCDCAGYTMANRLHNITIDGEGTIDANGKALFRKELDEKKASRGRALYLCNTDGVCLRGITVRNSPAWCVHLIYCTDILMEQVKVYTKWDAESNSYGIFNGDGVDVDSCKNVEIRDCMISSQDDCIALKSGRDAEGRRVGVATENVRITNCQFRSGFGVALGSEMSGGIRNVVVRDCDFVDTYSVGSIKAPRGRGNVVEDVLFENHRFVNHSTEHSDCRWFRGAINVDMFYSIDACDFTAAMPKDEGTPLFRNIVFRDITLETVAGNAIFLAGLPEQPLQNISLINVKAKGKYGLQVHNVEGLTMENVEVSVL